MPSPFRFDLRRLSSAGAHERRSGSRALERAMRYARRVTERTIVSTLLLFASACNAAQPSAPQARVATPVTVTRENPAGDAEEPEDAALTRLLHEKASERRDRTGTLATWLPDAERWRRVKLFGHPTRATHRYGDEHFALDSLDYRPASGDDTAEACLQHFVDRARDKANRYGVALGPIAHGQGQYAQGVESSVRRATPPPLAAAEESPLLPSSPRTPVGAPLGLASMPYVRGTGDFTAVFARHRYAGAVAAYRSWPGTCLVHAFAVRVGTDEGLALKVVDRWLEEIAPRTRWLPRSRRPPRFEDR